MRITKKTLLATTVLCLLLLYLYNLLPLVLSWGPPSTGNNSNYRNVSVRTTVNVTNAYPEIINITCNNGTSIILTAGSTTGISCLVQIRDYNGGNTINSTNSTFYYYLNQSSDPSDNNTNYINTTCTESTPNGYYVNWTCAFDLLYYANNGSWRANITVKDTYNLTTNTYINVTISSLYALNVTPLIDFQNMAVGDTTINPVGANITNLGNMNINISLYGFGGEDELTGSGYAMLCEVRNITLPNERYSLSSGAAYDSMTAITGSQNTIPGLTIPQQINDSKQEINSTYWRLHVNLTTNPFGICNGTVVFAAIAP